MIFTLELHVLFISRFDLARRSTVGDCAYMVAVWNTLQHLCRSQPSVNDLKLGFSENHLFYFSSVYS